MSITRLRAVAIDGTLIETDRCRTPGPTPGVDLWWSGKQDNHGGNVQVITTPDDWPLWTRERGNSLLKITFKALRNVSLCPRSIGRITAAALAILKHRARPHHLTKARYLKSRAVTRKASVSGAIPIRRRAGTG